MSIPARARLGKRDRQSPKNAPTLQPTSRSARAWAGSQYRESVLVLARTICPPSHETRRELLPFAGTRLAAGTTRRPPALPRLSQRLPARNRRYPEEGMAAIVWFLVSPCWALRP